MTGKWKSNFATKSRLPLPYLAVSNTMEMIMRGILFVAMMLMVVTAVWATGNSGSGEPAKGTDQGLTGQQNVQTPQPVEGTSPQSNPSLDKHTAILTQVEADSLRMQGDSLLAQSGMKDISVGAISSTDLIYILVVVVLVIVVIRLI